jgi:hypothetical protein
MNKVVQAVGGVFLMFLGVYGWWYFTALWAQVRGMKTLEGVGMFITLLTPVALMLGGMAGGWAARRPQGAGKLSCVPLRYLLASLGVLAVCAAAAYGLVAAAGA